MLPQPWSIRCKNFEHHSFHIRWDTAKSKSSFFNFKNPVIQHLMTSSWRNDNCAVLLLRFNCLMSFKVQFSFNIELLSREELRGRRRRKRKNRTITRGVRAHIARTPKNRTITRGVRAHIARTPNNNNSCSAVGRTPKKDLNLPWQLWIYVLVLYQLSCLALMLVERILD